MYTWLVNSQFVEYVSVMQNMLSHIDAQRRSKMMAEAADIATEIKTEPIRYSFMGCSPMPGKINDVVGSMYMLCDLNQLLYPSNQRNNSPRYTSSNDCTHFSYCLHPFTLSSSSYTCLLHTLIFSIGQIVL